MKKIVFTLSTLLCASVAIAAPFEFSDAPNATAELIFRNLDNKNTAKVSACYAIPTKY